MSQDSPERAAAIKARQANCKHSFIKGASDSVHTCVWCGLLMSEHADQQQPQGSFSWSGSSMNGIP